MIDCEALLLFFVSDNQFFVQQAILFSSSSLFSISIAYFVFLALSGLLFLFKSLLPYFSEYPSMYPFSTFSRLFLSLLGTRAISCNFGLLVLFLCTWVLLFFRCHFNLVLVLHKLIRRKSIRHRMPLHILCHLHRHY